MSDYLISDSPGCCAHCGFFHSSAKCPPQMAGRELYEADLLDRPNYHDGTPRKTWEQLSDVARQSWERKWGPAFYEGSEINLCEDCPPFDYPTDKTRCAPCPRRSAP